MLDYAYKYQNLVAQLFTENVTHPDCKYFQEGTYLHMHWKAYPDTWKEIQKVSISKSGDEVLGLLEARVNRDSYFIENFSFISFERGNSLFIEDIKSFIRELQNKKFRKIRLSCWDKNPKRETIESILKEFNADLVGVFKNEALINGEYNDQLIYEIETPK